MSSIQIQIIGWTAAGLTLVAFSMRTMIPLRIVSIGANFAFISFGVLSSNYPVLILHCILLPFNVTRLVQMRRLVRKVAAASTGDIKGEWLRPYAQTLRLAAGDRLFAQGEQADHTFFLVEGRIQLPAIGQHIEAGELIGEIALFSPGGVRTLTAVATAPCTLLRVSNQALRELYHQNPAFGFHLVRLVTRRLMADSERLRAQLGSAAAGSDPVTRSTTAA
jgi:hypothetical protein